MALAVWKGTTVTEGCVITPNVTLFTVEIPDGLVEASAEELFDEYSTTCGCEGETRPYTPTAAYRILVNGTLVFDEIRSFPYCGVTDALLEVEMVSPLLKKTLSFNDTGADIDINFQLGISETYDANRLNWLVWTARIRITNAAQIDVWQHFQKLLRGKYGRGFLLVDSTVTGEFFINFTDYKPGYYNCYNPWVDAPRDEHIPGNIEMGQLIAWNGGPLQTGNLLANRLVLEFDTKCAFTVELIGWNQTLFIRGGGVYDEVYFF